MSAEPPRWTAERRARMAQRYPEFSQADAQTVLGVDGMKVASGLPPSQFGATVMRLAAGTAIKQ